MESTNEHLKVLLKRVPETDPLFKKIALTINRLELEEKCGRAYHEPPTRDTSSQKQREPMA